MKVSLAASGFIILGVLCLILMCRVGHWNPCAKMQALHIAALMFAMVGSAAIITGAIDKAATIEGSKRDGED